MSAEQSPASGHTRRGRDRSARPEHRWPVLIGIGEERRHAALHTRACHRKLQPLHTHRAPHRPTTVLCIAQLAAHVNLAFPQRRVAAHATDHGARARHVEPNARALSFPELHAARQLPHTKRIEGERYAIDKWSWTNNACSHNFSDP